MGIVCNEEIAECNTLSLETAYQERNGILIYLNVHPRWDPIRDDPRFHDLLLRMNLEP